MDVAWSLLLAPVGETVLLAMAIGLLSKASLSARGIAAVSAAVFGVLHGVALGWPYTFFGAWGFYFFSLAYMRFRARSLLWGLAAAAIPHSMANGLSLLTSLSGLYDP